MHLNRQQLLGRLSRLPKLDYKSNGTPFCTFTLEVDSPDEAGQLHTGYHRVEITGRHAERWAATLEPGDEVYVEGQHQYRSTVDPKTQAKVVKCVLSTWGVSQHIRTLASVPQPETSPPAEGREQGEERPPRTEAKPRRRSYPKAALQGGFQN
jgi:single-stranded DNA-binding protein